MMTLRVLTVVCCLCLSGVARGQAIPSEVRILPVDETVWTADIRAGIESFGINVADATNLHRVLANHPQSLHGIGPLAAYLRQRSMVTVVDQILMGLRAAWLCRSEAVWAELVVEARSVGLGDQDLRRIAEGPDAGWGPWDATVLRATDELYRDSFLSDESWRLMSMRYDLQQLMDIIFIGSEFIMLSMLANSFGVQPDEQWPDRFPVGIARSAVQARANPSPLTEPRVEPIHRDEWSDEVQTLLDPGGTGGSVLNLYATLAHHPILFRPRAVQSSYIRIDSTLSDRAREILILRIGWLCGSEYEWSQHVRVARRVGMNDEEIRRVAIGATADGWDPLGQLLIRVVDELHADNNLSDATWALLSEYYSNSELIDVVITVAGYRMVSIALNSIGTQLEPDRPRFPDLRR